MIDRNMTYASEVWPNIRFDGSDSWKHIHGNIYDYDNNRWLVSGDFAYWIRQEASSALDSMICPKKYSRRRDGFEDIVSESKLKISVEWDLET